MKLEDKIYVVNMKPEQIAIKKFKRINTLHDSLKSILLLAQCMGQMPVCGITDSDSKHLKFKLQSWRFIYCLFNCIGSGILTLTCLYRIFVCGLDIFQSANIGFHLSTFTMTILFIKLAMEWPRLMKNWTRVDFLMKNYGYPKRLQIRIALITGLMLFVAFVEYMLDKLSWFLLQDFSNNNVEHILKYYFIGKLHPQIFLVINYTIWKGILVQIVNFLTTFAWSFTDIFIMLMSTALALRFQQITMRLMDLRKSWKDNNKDVWQQVREDYNRLSILTRNLDKAISYIVLISFANNLFFILMQLFNSLRPMKNTVEKIYFFVSFGFLILRTVCVSIYGAWVFDESKEPTVVLNSISSELYDIEVNRFVDQVKFDTIALTGNKFFYITRGLVLSMAGAVVTYELVLIQFNQNLLKENAIQNIGNFTGLSC